MPDPVILQKIDSLNRCIARIEEKRPASLSILQENIDLQDIVAINLERAVQQCVDIAMNILSFRELPVPSTMSEAFDELLQIGIINEDVCLNMKNAVGFRNAIVHAYRKINWSIVWDIISNRLGDFRGFARQVLNIS
jgi:uncharacterized protein YutE (UPF0331/DUF86 family)